MHTTTIETEGIGLRSARAFLKTATASLHERVEARFATIFDVGEWGYGRFLRASARAVFSLEHALWAGGSNNIIADWEARTRSASLSADLAALGIAEPANATILKFESESFMFGVLYVLEGSRLGAAQLARAARSSPSRRVRFATRYLVHGQSQRLWPSFLEQLEASPAVRSYPYEAARGARAAFSAFDDGVESLEDESRMKPADEDPR